MTAPVAHAGAAPRLLRAAVFTAVCVVLAATGHVLAACAPVPWWTLLLGFLGVFAVAAPLAGRPRSTATIVAALTGGQLTLHTLFGLGQGPMVMSGRATPGRSDDAVVDLASKLVCGPSGSSLSHSEALRIVTSSHMDPGMSAEHAHMAMGSGMGSVMGAATGTGALGLAEGLLPTLPMALAHLLAALATGWLLRHGDLALVRLSRLSAHGIGEFTENAQLRALRAALTLVQALLAGLPGVPVPEPHLRHLSYGPPPVPAGETLQHTVIRRGPPAALALAA
jgi:hypothetical protein